MVSVCPSAIVNAPVEKVWRMLENTANYDVWWDARTERLDPPGPAQAGQTLYASSQEFGRRWPLTLTLELVDAEKHQLRFRSTLPFGMSMVNHISCGQVNETTTRLQFG
jgi:hypothetical protein